MLSTTTSTGDGTSGAAEVHCVTLSSVQGVLLLHDVAQAARQLARGARYDGRVGPELGPPILPAEFGFEFEPGLNGGVTGAGLALAGGTSVGGGAAMVGAPPTDGGLALDW